MLDHRLDVSALPIEERRFGDPDALRRLLLRNTVDDSLPPDV
jgi:hypothetical protein